METANRDIRPCEARVLEEASRGHCHDKSLELSFKIIDKYILEMAALIQKE